MKRVELFAQNEGNVEIYANADQTEIHDTLNKETSLGGLWAGKLTNTPATPTDKYTLYVNDNSMEDLWLALAWGKGD